MSSAGGSKSTGRSASSIQADGDAARALAALLRATKKFQDRFHDSARARETTWHRLAVKLERGRVVSIQLISDEAIDVPRADEPTQPQES